MAVTINGTSGLTFNDSSTQSKSAATGQTGAAPFYSARAWVNFNGTGTVAIHASGNVSSITDNGTGDYTINFATAMPDAIYNVVGFCRHNDDTGGRGIVSARNSATKTTSALRVITGYSGTNTLQDEPEIGISIFR